MPAAEFVAVNYRLWQQAPATRRTTWLVRLAFLMLSVSLLLNLYQHQQTGTPLAQTTPVFLGVALLYAWWRPWQVKRLLRQGYRANPVLQQPTTYHFDAAGFAGESPAGRFAARWDTIRRVVRVGDWLLLYPSATACNYVDLRRIVAPGTPAELVRLLAARSIAVQQLGKLPVPAQ